MKKTAYILAYIGIVSTILISILSAFVTYSYHLDQPTVLSQKSVTSSIIFIFLNILILILIYKLDFQKNFSSFLLIFTVIISLILPIALELKGHLTYFSQYNLKELFYIIYNMLYGSLSYFPLFLIIVAGILFIINNKNK